MSTDPTIIVQAAVSQEFNWLRVHLTQVFQYFYHQYFKKKFNFMGQCFVMFIKPTVNNLKITWNSQF